MTIASQTPDIMGDRQSGQDVRTQNVMACQAVANIVKSSLGPVGLDKVFSPELAMNCLLNPEGNGTGKDISYSMKSPHRYWMLIDDIGDVTFSNDGATILKMLDVEHPTAKVLVELAELHDREAGDGTTSMVIIAAELLKIKTS